MEGKVSFAPVYGDGMVLQRGMPLSLRGGGPAGARVRVEFGKRAAIAKASSKGEWSIRLPALEASAEPRELRASIVGGGASAGLGASAAIRDVLVGDVWFCSGQSNMEMGLASAEGGLQEADHADIPSLRLYLGPKSPSGIPADDAGGSWKSCSKASVLEGGWGGFSAVAYYFGKRMVAELGVPVGLVQSAFGGAKIQPFIRPDRLRGNDLLRKAGDEWRRGDAAWRRENTAWKAAGSPGSPAAHPFAGFTEYDDLKPSSLWNGMVHPFRGMAFRGVLWYQGESNIGDGGEYVGMMRALLASFRRTFGRPLLPLYFVQIAPWKYGDDRALFDLWEAQKMAARVPGMAMAITADVGDLVDIHPLRKEPVGERLARVALKRCYGRSGVLDEGPRFVRATFHEGGARLSFRCARGGLESADGAPLAGFELAGDDGIFSGAEASIDGDAVMLRWKPGKPRRLRYCRRLEQVPTLTDASGIPALPFGPY